MLKAWPWVGVELGPRIVSWKVYSSLSLSSLLLRFGLTVILLVKTVSSA